MCFALDTGIYKSIYDNSSETSSIRNFAGYALGAAQVIGMAVAVIGAVILGMKYMFSSPDMKATIKDKLVIYVTGIIIIFAASGLIGLIGEWAKSNI